MVEVAEELVEAVHGRQKFVLVAEVVLAELAGGVAERLETSATLGSSARKPDVGARQTDLGQPRADRRLSGDEGGASGGAALFAVPVGEHRAFFGDAVDVRRAVAHHAVIVGAHVEPADVVGHDHQDVRLACGWCGRGTLLSLRRLCDPQNYCRRESQNHCPELNAAAI